jgi:adenosylhomocysteinase
MPAINVNDSVTKSKFDNKYGCKESGRCHPPRHRHHDGRQSGRSSRLRRRRQRLCRFSARRRRRVIVTEIDPICALQAAMDGF